MMNELNTTTGSQSGNEFADLDSLFAQTRNMQPELQDENITKLVLNSLPDKPKRTRVGVLSFDIVGLLLGVIAAYMFFDLGQIADSFLALVPSSFSLTLANVGAVFAGLIAMTFGAWWLVER